MTGLDYDCADSFIRRGLMPPHIGWVKKDTGETESAILRMLIL